MLVSDQTDINFGSILYQFQTTVYCFRVKNITDSDHRISESDQKDVVFGPREYQFRVKKMLVLDHANINFRSEKCCF